MTDTITRRTEDVLIFQGDDASAIAAALADVNRSLNEEQLGGRRLNDESPSSAAAKVYDQVVAEATPRAVRATVQALGRKSYRGLLAAHPPLEDNAKHHALGFNPETFHDALLEFFDTDTGEKTLITPSFEARQSLVDWLDDLNDGNFTQLSAAALRVNQGGSPDPKASLTSQLALLFDETSPSPASMG